MLAVDSHPLLFVEVFVTRFPSALETLPSTHLVPLLQTGAPAPMPPADDALRGVVRDLLRYGGYKPTGRGKPASEYLVRAVESGALASINLAVDACNVASLHSGFPISVVDLDRVAPGGLRIGLAPAGTSYVFNAGGQEIDVSGLVCLFDGAGPCANAVKDSQRTKTHTATTRTLSVVWGTRALEARVRATTRWYRELLEAAGASTEEAPLS
jgi:DNA/RNA-binding domain of Phe-tRNA-synthetase-like protein